MEGKEQLIISAINELKDGIRKLPTAEEFLTELPELVW